MRKPNSTYKMTKQTKRFLARIVDPAKRAQFKHMFIDAELTALERPAKTADN